MKFRLVQTSAVNPESYDVFDGQEFYGRMQLIHGGFDVWNRFNVVVYHANTRGDGTFHDDRERDTYIKFGLAALSLEFTNEYTVEGKSDG